MSTAQLWTDSRALNKSQESQTFTAKNIFSCIIAPSCLILFSLYFSQAFNARQDMLNTVLHLILIYLVPASNFMFLFLGGKGKASPSISMLAALGLATGVSAAYAEVFLHLIPSLVSASFSTSSCFLSPVFGVAAFWLFWRPLNRTTQIIIFLSALAIWALTYAVWSWSFYSYSQPFVFLYSIESYVAYSFVAYVLSQIILIPVSCMHGTWLKFREQLALFYEDKRAAVTFAAICISAGLAAPFLIDAPIEISRLASRKISQQGTESSRASLRLLTLFGDKQALLEACYASFVPNLDMAALALRDDGKIADAHKAFYRISGHRVLDLPRPELRLDAPLKARQNQYHDIEESDPLLAEQEINGVLPGLSMSLSKQEIHYSQNLPLASSKWRMIFTNNSHETREARAIIQMPKGGVLRAASILMQGHQIPVRIQSREGAIQSYQNTVRYKRDPLLITTAGRDRLFVQCYPVIGIHRHAGNGNHYLQIELEIAYPLSSSEEGSGVPQIVDHNFQGLATDIVELNSPCVQRQQNVSSKTRRIENLYIVLDGAQSLKAQLGELKALLAKSPESLSTTLVLASDTISDLSPLHNLPKASDFKRDLADLSPVYFSGGPDNLPFLRRAFREAKGKNNSAVLWLHGPQPYLYGNLRSADIAAIFSGANKNGTMLIDCQILPGANKILQSIDESFWQNEKAEIETVNYSSKDNSRLSRLLKERVLSVNDEYTELDSALSRNLICFEDKANLDCLASKRQVENLLAKGKLNEACNLAISKQVLTAASGAVALEPPGLNLSPVPSSSPQPSSYEPGLDGAIKGLLQHSIEEAFRTIVSQLNRLNATSMGNTNNLNKLQAIPSNNSSPAAASYSEPEFPNAVEVNLFSSRQEAANQGKSRLSLNKESTEKANAGESLLNLNLALILSYSIRVFAIALTIVCASQVYRQKSVLRKVTFISVGMLALLTVCFAEQISDLILVLLS